MRAVRCSASKNCARLLPTFTDIGLITGFSVPKWPRQLRWAIYAASLMQPWRSFVFAKLSKNRLVYHIWQHWTSAHACPPLLMNQVRILASNKGHQNPPYSISHDSNQCQPRWWPWLEEYHHWTIVNMPEEYRCIVVSGNNCTGIVPYGQNLDASLYVCVRLCNLVPFIIRG